WRLAPARETQPERGPGSDCRLLATRSCSWWKNPPAECRRLFHWNLDSFPAAADRCLSPDSICKEELRRLPGVAPVSRGRLGSEPSAWAQPPSVARAPR